MSVEVESVTKRYGDMVALDAVSTTIPNKSFVTFLGPSGCGKTTLLRVLAGLITPDDGRVVAYGEVLSAPGKLVAPERRKMGMVFQGFAVWPHMTVFQNVAYGLELRGLPKAEITERVAKSLALIKLTGLERRYPKQLSGGQQQRVALARSIVVEPRVLLLDEPLSNLDAKLRQEMRTELRDLQRRVGISFVYVTHDQDEALSVSDKIVVLNGGRVEQAGTPQEIYERPQTAFVAGFLGSPSTLRGRLLSVADGYAMVDVGGCVQLRCRVPTASALEQDVDVCIRSNAIAIDPAAAAGAQNVLEAEVQQIQYFGDTEEVLLRAGGFTLKARGLPGSSAAGAQLRVRLDAERCLVFPPARA
jgi:iron(III) transport system ATP-binding protein